ncbi:MAG: amidohydrolase family protein [Candidatus Marinimicrobia bacterium]|nr:amidohydrolase family protein [Candidatus Neomarinimicrobiota bacterium]
MVKADAGHRTLLLGGRIIAPGEDQQFIAEGFIEVTDGIITAVGPGDPPAAEVNDLVDLSGLTILPGMINAHTHLYSALALGMPPPEQPPASFQEILERVWWRLDRALDAESTRSSFEVGLVDSLRAGVTTVIDHHSSPSFVGGSLDQLAAVAGGLGLNVAVAFEATDRNGEEAFEAALEENLAARRKFAADPYVQPLLGLHASFTLSDRSLKRVRAVLDQEPGWGLHIHLAEDRADQSDAVEQGYPSVVQRLDHFGLINQHSLLAHGLHLQPGDLDVLERERAMLVHNPTSNANNSVGLLAAETIERLRSGLGTDGMQANMLAEAKEGALIRSSHQAGGETAVDYLGLLFNHNAELATRLFGRPLGRISPGYQADLAIYDYQPRTAITADNFGGHLLFGLDRPREVMVRGRFRLYDGELVETKESEIRQRAREQSLLLWQRMNDL